MPIVRPYPIGEVSPQPIPNVAPNVAAAGDINLFGGNQARDLQQAGQNLGQASDTLFALYQREATQANDNRVQDANNQYITGEREILRTGPDAYYKQTGADAINGAAATTERLTKLKDQILGQAPNDYQRQKLRPILDAHLAASAEGIARHADKQQAVYGRTVAATAIETSRADAGANPANLTNAMARAEDATRFLYRGQAPEVVESEVRKAGGSVASAAIENLLARNDPSGVRLFQQYRDRLDPRDRRTLGAATETLSNTVEATAWLRDRSATLRTPAPTGDAALDAVNVASASITGPPPVVSSVGMLLDQDGIVGTGQRLDEIEERRRALTALNEQELAADPARLRANQTVIDTDTARSRASVKAETDSVYADLQRHLTTGGPNGGPAVAPPPATIMSRLTDAQQDAVTAQVNANIEGRKTRTDPQIWYAIRQGLTGDDADERQRWASKNLVQFMGRLSDEDFAALEKLQTAVRTNDGGADQSRLQIITRMANQVLRSAGIDPTPRPDAAPDSDVAQAARFHRALQDELSAVESKGRKPTETEAYDIVNSLKDTSIKSGWLKVSDHPTYPTMTSDIQPTDDAFEKDGPFLAQAEPRDDKPQEGRSGAAPAIEPYPGSQVYRDAQQLAESLGRSGVAPLTEPPSNDPDFIKALETSPGVPVVLPNGSHIKDTKSPTGYVMAPFPGLESVVNAARRARSDIIVSAVINPTTAPTTIAQKMYAALKNNAAQGGNFDYQRQANKDQKDGYVQLRQFRNVSNVNVGLFCQQLGLPRAIALKIAGRYAGKNSGNARPDQPYGLDPDTKYYIDVGYDLGESGLFD